ncbi:MAG: DNA repair protein RecN [Boseongicola sp. SB0677_bin_26]|nr:DNA repair protein RecN [Boseongicola sp. SB0665_bin_10]MYG26668.1 DNA repair protein RecN [Boseongicola sp. SB0677_bin_26]
MLRSLDIRDILIIDRLELTLCPGLNVLTGETGAGKTILLDALGFVLGWRGRAELVRKGAEQGEVIAEFELSRDHAAREVLKEAGLPAEDELILRRVNARDGRKTSWVNDRRVSGEVLRQLSDALVEVHGQNDDRGLLNPGVHRRLLDAFGGLEIKVARCRTTWSCLKVAESVLAETEARLAALRDEEGFLRHAVDEMDRLAPEAGEDVALDARRRLMRASGQIREDVVRARTALGPDGAEGMIGDASRWLEGAAESVEGVLDDPMAALSRALDEVGNAEQGVSRILEALEFDAAELERVEERLFDIRAMSRKHAVPPDDLPGLADEFRAKLAALGDGASGLAERKQAVDEARKACDAAASELGKARATAAKKLDAAMSRELPPLKMERARFSTQVTRAEPGPEGGERVEFTIATNPGMPAGPLNRIASGGELSRFLLALKVCLTAGADDLTMIFDEIDRGVGGATADAVGRRLEALARGSQVLVVTHSPQVAARAGHHCQVEKSVEDDVTLSRVTPLSADERVDEIARMLSGDTVTDEAKAAARALLAA